MSSGNGLIGETSFVSISGTGTPRGDPTEINALGEFFVAHKQRNKSIRPLLIGSVKSNIGHTESAAGIAGLLKVLLMMKHGKYVPTLHVKPDKSNLNRKIRLQNLNLDIALQVEDWKEIDGERTACLNSFGFGGSNAHAVVKQKSNFVDIDVAAGGNEEKVVPVCVSAIDIYSLKQNLLKFQKDLKSDGSNMRDISYTSLFHRDIFSYRTVVFGKNADDLIQEIQSKLKTVKTIPPARDRHVVFVFCGVGTTWNGMCQELMVKNGPFRTMITAIDGFLFPLSGWKIGDKLSSESNYDDPFLNHIAIFAVQVALSNMWKAYGIEPDVIVGQSVGEVAAACVANFLSLKEAVHIIYHRSKILAEQSDGTMMVVGNMDIEEIEEHCRKLNDRVTIAVYSSPKACTLSGLAKDIQELKQTIEEDAKDKNKSVLIKELGVKCAYHSKLVEPCTSDIRSAIDEILKSTPDADLERIKNKKKVQMVSTVTGCVTSFTEVRTGEYWANNVRMPVRFMQGISESLAENGMNLLLEIGPRPVLRAHLPAIMGDKTNAKIFPSLLAKKELSRVQSTISELFEHGVDFDWTSISCPEKQRRISGIPRYDFNRSTELHYPNKVKVHLAGERGRHNDSHMFVMKIPSSDSKQFEILVNNTHTPFVYEHFLSGSILVPGATYVETGFKIGVDILKKPINQLSIKVDFVNTFSPASDKEYRLYVDTTRTGKESLSFLVSFENRTLATGEVIEKEPPAKKSLNIPKIKAKLQKKVSKADVYKSLAEINFTYGKSLTLIQSAWASTNECLAEIHFPEESAEDLTSTHFHPAIVDAVFQMFGVLKNVQFAVPKGVGTVTLVGHLEHKMYCYARETRRTQTSSNYNALLLSMSGSVVAEFKNFHTKAVSGIPNSTPLPNIINWEELGKRVQTSGSLEERHIVVFTSSIKYSLLQGLRVLVKTSLFENMTDTAVADILQSGCSSVVYHVGPSSVESKAENELLSDCVRRFMDVKTILSTLSRYKMSVPFTILTQNTQPFSDRNEINLNGSELWGLMRSASHEGLYSNWKLLDIDSENVDLKTLGWMLTNTVPYNKEFQQIGDKVYKAKLKRTDKTTESVRELNISQRRSMCLSSSKPDLVEEPFFYKEQLNGCDNVKESESIEINLCVSVIHDTSIYLSTINEPVEEDDIWWSESGFSHYQMLTLEGQGQILQNEKEIDTNVVFCYPVSTKTTVYVPPECVITKESGLPYKNGLLIELVVLLNMVMALPHESNVILITGHDKGGLCWKFCEEVCEQRGINATPCRLKDIRRKEKVNQVVNLILLVPVDAGILENLLRKFPSAREMVSIQSMFSLETQTWAQYRFPGTNITVLKPGDIFRPKSLKTSMVVVKEYLKSSKQTEIAALLFKLPMKEISLESMLRQQTSKFLCDKNSLFDSQGCYILIGGLTGLGWELLQLLAEMGAGYIIPMSRRKPTLPQTDDLSSIMRKYGCHICPLQVDISDYKSVQSIFDEIESRFHGIPVRGIFHGAGVLSDTILLNQNEETVRKVLIPKVLGTWNLHKISLNLPLDFFVMHSSIVSVIGNQGQCNYAAGNSFMDSLASYRRSIGLPAQSLNWGALAVGMATNDPQTEKALESRGFKSLQKDQIKQFFIDALMNNDNNVVLADINWDMLASNPTFMDQKEKYETLMGSARHAKLDTFNKSSAEHTKLLDLEPIKRQEEVLKILKSIVNDIFVVDDNSINHSTSLVALGVDSMQAMSFSNKLNEIFSFQIPLVSLLSEQCTLSVIAESVISSMKVSTVKANPKSKPYQHTLETNDGSENDMDHLFSSDGYTFMQIGILEENRLKKTDAAQVRISEAELKNVRFDLIIWKKVLEHVLKINPELRKLYSFSSDGQIKVQMVPSEGVQPDVTVETMESLLSQHPYDRLDDITFDLEKDLPVRLRIGQNETGTLFRILLHGVVADTTSTAIICKDIQTTLLCYTQNNDLPGEKKAVNITQAIRNALKPRLYDLHSFWSSYLNVPLSPVSFGFPVTDVNDEYYEQSSHMVPQTLVQQIQEYMGKKRLTLYNVMLSMYQLLLHFETGATHIPVGTAVDMRYHVPEIATAITRCTNYVPVVATVDSNLTIDDYIAGNSRNIAKTTQHAAYPSKLYNKETQEHLIRHRIVMNDISAFKALENTANIRSIMSKLSHETFLRVKYDLRKQWVELETGFNSDIVGWRKGENLPKDLVRLVEACLRDTSKRIVDIQEERGATPKQTCLQYQDAKEVEMEVDLHVVSPQHNDVPVHGNQTNGYCQHKGKTVLLEGKGIRIFRLNVNFLQKNLMYL